MSAMLVKDDILRGLHKIDVKAKEAAVVVDLSIYGGAAMALVFDTRRATRDVDAVVHGAPDFLRTLARTIAEEEGWPLDWLNDGVKGFTSATEKLRLMENFTASPAGGLRIHTPAPELFQLAAIDQFRCAPAVALMRRPRRSPASVQFPLPCSRAKRAVPGCARPAPVGRCARPGAGRPWSAAGAA